MFLIYGGLVPRPSRFFAGWGQVLSVSFHSSCGGLFVLVLSVLGRLMRRSFVRLLAPGLGSGRFVGPVLSVSFCRGLGFGFVFSALLILVLVVLSFLVLGCVWILERVAVSVQFLFCVMISVAVADWALYAAFPSVLSLRSFSVLVFPDVASAASWFCSFSWFLSRDWS